MTDQQPDAWMHPQPEDGFVRGLLLLLLLHLLQVPMTILSGGMSLFFIGATQLLYFVPVLVFLICRKRRETIKGLCTAAAITFLLNATCTGIVSWALREV